MGESLEPVTPWWTRCNSVEHGAPESVAPGTAEIVTLRVRMTRLTRRLRPESESRLDRSKYIYLIAGIVTGESRISAP